MTHRRKALLSPRTYIMLLAAMLLLSGCTKYVVLKQEFPVPVMQKHPYTVTLLLEDSLRNYVHEEKFADEADWKVQFGIANVALYTQMMEGMFERVEVVNKLNPNRRYGTIIKPRMADYQLSTPTLSSTDYYEVWIKYELEVLTGKGTPVTSWPFTAYGRNPKKFGAAESALAEATRRAMRDAAAAVVLDFMNEPAVKAHFQGQSSGTGSGR